MLVLERKNGQSVLIEGVGRITLTRAANGSARLCFDMPRSIAIVREELHGFHPVPESESIPDLKSQISNLKSEVPQEAAA